MPEKLLLSSRKFTDAAPKSAAGWSAAEHSRNRSKLSRFVVARAIFCAKWVKAYVTVPGCELGTGSES
jgi:hypothetical protein